MALFVTGIMWRLIWSRDYVSKITRVYEPEYSEKIDSVINPCGMWDFYTVISCCKPYVFQGFNRKY